MDHCPHCGSNQNEDNGLLPSDPEFLLLCVNRVSLEDSTHDDPAFADLNGMVNCGMTWNPADYTIECDTCGDQPSGAPLPAPGSECGRDLSEETGRPGDVCNGQYELVYQG